MTWVRITSEMEAVVDIGDAAPPNASEEALREAALAVLDASGGAEWESVGGEARGYAEHPERRVQGPWAKTLLPEPGMGSMDDLAPGVLRENQLAPLRPPLRNWWVSWYEAESGFEYHGPWWVTGPGDRRSRAPDVRRGRAGTDSGGREADHRDGVRHAARHRVALRRVAPRRLGAVQRPVHPGRVDALAGDHAVKIELEPEDYGEIRDMCLGNIDDPLLDNSEIDAVLASMDNRGYILGVALGFGWGDTEVRDQFCAAVEKYRARST